VRIAPEHFVNHNTRVKKLLQAHLPAAPAAGEEDLDAALRNWQEQDGAKLMPAVDTQTLFAQWAEEDSRMTAEERQAENRLREDLEKGLLENSRLLQLRRPS